MDNLLFTHDVENITRLTRQTIHRFIKEKNFPHPSKIGNKNAWYESEVIQWLNDQMENGKNNDNNQ